MDPEAELESVRADRDRLERYLDLTNTMLVALDRDARVTMANRPVTDVLGYTEAELLGEDWLALVYRGPQLPLIRDVFRRFVDGDVETVKHLETAALGKDGEVHILQTHNTPLRDATGAIVGTLSSAEDITERRAAETALVAERDRARRYLDMAGAMMVALDRDGRVTLVNRKVTAVLGYAEHELIGADWIETVIPEADRAADRAAFTRIVAGEIERFEEYENTILTRTGEPRTIAWRVAVDLDAEGRVVATLGAGEDVTERRRAERQIAHMAYHDHLTGLANRTLFDEHLQHAVAAARRSGESVALLFMDLDRFKLVNDSLGHAAGDLLLQMFAERLSALTRESDLLARQGGDEFMLMLTGLKGDPRADVATVVSKLAEATAAPFVIAGTEFRIGISTGVSLFPLDADSAGALLRNADAAMYLAKSAGRGRAAYFAAGG